MAVLAAIVLPALLLEHQHGVGAGVLDDGAGDLGAGNQRRAQLVAGHQHVSEFDRGAGIARNALDGDLVVGGNAVLLTAGADDAGRCRLDKARGGTRASTPEISEAPDYTQARDEVNTS